MTKPFVPFDAMPYTAPSWLPDFLDVSFAEPKAYPMWDTRREKDKERLEAFATGIKQFLSHLPDGAEIGTAELAKCLHPDRYEDEPFRKFLINRIGQCRFWGLLDKNFYSIADTRWKRPRSFYKHHNGRGKTNDEKL